MTPKETAKDLYHKFQVYEVNGQKRTQYGPQVKVFALIVVNEISNEVIGLCGVPYDVYEYWEQVKEELEKL